jgi:hypothetical protein
VVIHARACRASYSIKRPVSGGFVVERVQAPFPDKLTPIMKCEPGLTYRFMNAMMKVAADAFAAESKSAWCAEYFQSGHVGGLRGSAYPDR